MKLAKSIMNAVAHRPRLHAALEEQARALLEVDDRARVRERGRGVALGDSAHGLVQDVRDHEQRQLQQRVGAALRQPAKVWVLPGAVLVPAQERGRARAGRASGTTSRNTEKMLTEEAADVKELSTKCLNGSNRRSGQQSGVVAADRLQRASERESDASPASRPGRSARSTRPVAARARRSRSPDPRCRYGVGSHAHEPAAGRGRRPTVNDCGVWLTSRAPARPLEQPPRAASPRTPASARARRAAAGRAARPAPGRPPSRPSSRARASGQRDVADRPSRAASAGSGAVGQARPRRRARCASRSSWRSQPRASAKRGDT